MPTTDHDAYDRRCRGENNAIGTQLTSELPAGVSLLIHDPTTAGDDLEQQDSAVDENPSPPTGVIMKMPLRNLFTRGIALTGASAIAVTLSVAPPTSAPTAMRTQLADGVHLLAAVEQSTPTDAQYPSLFQQIRRGIVPSLGLPIPKPPGTIAIPAVTDVNSAIKNVYNAVEPWVRYGFELGAYAVGWVPYVGWLSPQVIIFYNFGERIVRSITFNVDDWLFGPLPFLQGLGNVGRDSWNALVQLGIDQWNFWLPPLPPLPPLPLAAERQSVAASSSSLGPTDGMSIHELRATTSPSRKLNEDGTLAEGAVIDSAEVDTDEPPTSQPNSTVAEPVLPPATPAASVPIVVADEEPRSASPADESPVLTSVPDPGLASGAESDSGATDLDSGPADEPAVNSAVKASSEGNHEPVGNDDAA